MIWREVRKGLICPSAFLVGWNCGMCLTTCHAPGMIHVSIVLYGRVGVSAQHTTILVHVVALCMGVPHIFFLAHSKNALSTRLKLMEVRV